jgi:hypothetical protein
MDELQNRGGKLLYDPDFIVHRRPRSNLRSFMKMLITYGRGRAEQFRVHPTLGSALNFVPPLFDVYLLALASFLLLLGTGAIHFAPIFVYLVYLAIAPLALYGAIVLAQVAALIPRAGVAQSVGALPLIILTHVLYGFGFWRGLLTPLKHGGQDGTQPPMKVVLEHVPV